jgi:hypothetical protein
MALASLGLMWLGSAMLATPYLEIAGNMDVDGVFCNSCGFENCRCRRKTGCKKQKIKIVYVEKCCGCCDHENRNCNVCWRKCNRY